MNLKEFLATESSPTAKVMGWVAISIATVGLLTMAFDLILTGLLLAVNALTVDWYRKLVSDAVEDIWNAIVTVVWSSMRWVQRAAERPFR